MRSVRGNGRNHSIAVARSAPAMIARRTHMALDAQKKNAVHPTPPAWLCGGLGRRCSARLLHHGTADQPDVLAQRVCFAREFVGRVNLFDRVLDAIEVLEPLV